MPHTHTSNDYETIVIGAGAMGSAAAYHLARDQRSVLLLEQFEIGHGRGSSHGESRIIRLSYDLPTYVTLMKSAYRLWAELEADVQQQLYFRTGGLDLSALHHPAFEACLASLQMTNVRHEVLDETEIRRRFPQFDVAHQTIGLYQADAGILNPAQCVTRMAQRAAHYGAGVIDYTPARSIRVHDDGADVVTDSSVYHCRKLIVSAGAWAGPLLQSIHTMQYPVGVTWPLVVTQEQYAFFKPSQPELFTPDRFPIFIHYATRECTPVDYRTGDYQTIDHYGFPIFGRDSVKVGEHHAGPIVTADTRSFEVDAVRLRRLSEYVHATLPDLTGETIDVVTCLYTNTPDQHFMIDTLPGHPHVVIASPCSGHGFKFSILIGRILADLVERGETSYPIEMFSARRF